MTFFQPSLPVTTWRTLWPGQEMRRRGREVLIDTMDAGYSPEFTGGIAVVHLTPSLYAVESWRARLEDVRRRADRLIVNVDDDWTRMLDLPPIVTPGP